MPDAARADLIEGAALALLEAGGPSAVTTRAVAEAAGTQPTAIYRAYGDMDGLMDAVLRRGFDAYVTAKVERPQHPDPVEDLRAGWDLHVRFGLEHPHVYVALYGALHDGKVPEAAARGEEILRGMMQRAAAAGRLRVDVEQAIATVHAAGVGVVLTSLARAPEQRDPDLSTRVRESVLAAITDVPVVERSGRAGFAVGLAATLHDGPPVLSTAEARLLREWLARLAGDQA